MTRLLGRIAALALGTGLMVAGSTVGASAQTNMGSPEMSQTKGGYQTMQYRRAMHRYRNNPGARAELRRNRTIYCQGHPSRC